jgi:hypothetical protein
MQEPGPTKNDAWNGEQRGCNEVSIDENGGKNRECACRQDVLAPVLAERPDDDRIASSVNERKSLHTPSLQ